MPVTLGREICITNHTAADILAYLGVVAGSVLHCVSPGGGDGAGAGWTAWQGYRGVHDVL